MSITAERLMVEVQADVRQALAQLNRVEQASASTAGRLNKMARSMGVAFGGAAIVGGITKTIGLAMSFDKTMRQVGVQTGETGKSLTKLTDLAVKMGKETVFSAQDASGAMLELSKGGLNAAEIRAGALASTMKLAAVGGMDMASAATYVTQGMATFGLGAGKADSIVTALAGGADASTASVESLGMALSQVGPGATNAGMSIQETVAALAAFDQAGIKGSDAGTSLKTMLSSLVPATKKSANAMRDYGLEFVDSEGNFKSMKAVAQELKEGLGDLSQEERTRALRTIFGSDATRAATVMMRNGKKGLEGYLKATKDTDKAQQMANTTMEGASGAWENLKGAAETAAIQIGTKLLPAFTTAAETGAEWIDTMMGWGPEIEATFGWVPDMFRGMASALSPVVDLVKAAASAWSGLPGPVKELAVQGGLAMLIFPRLAAMATSASGSVVGAFTTMSAKARQFGAEMTYASTRAAALGRVARAAAGPAGMAAMMAGASSTDERVKALTTTLGAAAIGFSVGGPLGAAIGGLGGAFVALKGHSDRTRTAIEKTYARIQEAGGPVASAKASLNDLKATLDQVTGAYTGTTRAAVLQKLETAGLVEAGQKAGVSSRELVNAALGQKGAWSQVRGVIADYEAKITETTFAMQDLQRELKADMVAGRGRSDAKVQAINDLNRERVALRENIATLKQMPGQLRSQAQEVRKTAQATADYTGKLKGIPREKRTKIEAQGIKPTEQGVANLAKKYDLLDRKHVRTLVEATGADLSVKKIMHLIEKAKELGRQKANPKADLDDRLARRKVTDLERLILGPLTAATAKPKADLQDNATGPLRTLNGLISSTDGRTMTITTIHRNVTTGSSGGGGGGGGGGGTSGRLTYGGEDAGGLNDTESPFGRMSARMVDDQKNAVDDWVKNLSKSGQKMAEALVAGFTGSAPRIVAQIDKYAEKVTAAYDRRIQAIQDRGGRGAKKGETDAEQKNREAANKAAEKAGERRIKALERERDRILKAADKYRQGIESWRDATKSLDDGFGETVEDMRAKMVDLRKAIKQGFSGKAEARWLKVADAANTQLEGIYSRRAILATQLEEANRKVADLEQAKESFRDSVFGGMNSQATVLNAGNNAGAIAGNLQTQVAKVQEFAGMLSQLRGMGFSDAVVMQVASAGVEGGMSAARALVAANAAEVSSINSSMATITAQATATSTALSGQMYDSGIAGAQAVADGFQSQYDTMTAQIGQVTFALQEAMKAELKSGMRQNGRQAGQGLIDGLQDKKGPLGEAAAELGREMALAIKKELKIKSPSRVTMGLANMTGAGFVKGLLDSRRDVSRAGASMAQAAVPDAGAIAWDYRHPGIRPAAYGAQGGPGVSFTFITHNPVAEPESVTTNNALARVASLSLV